MSINLKDCFIKTIAGCRRSLSRFGRPISRGVRKAQGVLKRRYSGRLTKDWLPRAVRDGWYRTLRFLRTVQSCLLSGRELPGSVREEKKEKGERLCEFLVVIRNPDPFLTFRENSRGCFPGYGRMGIFLRDPHVRRIWEYIMLFLFREHYDSGSLRKRQYHFIPLMLFSIFFMGQSVENAEAGEAGTLPPEFRFSFRVARDDLNRILFPFPGITVSTVSEGEIRTDGGALYVLPDSDAPITLFVSPEDNPEVSFLLELLPDSGSARSYRIPLPRVLAGGRGAKGDGSDEVAAESRETQLSRGFTGIWKALNRSSEIPQEIAGYTRIPERQVRDSYGDISGLCNAYQETSFAGAWSRGEYLYVMLMLKNSLAVKTDIYCPARKILGYSLLNTTAVSSGGQRRIIVALHRSV